MSLTFAVSFRSSRALTPFAYKVARLAQALSRLHLNAQTLGLLEKMQADQGEVRFLRAGGAVPNTRITIVRYLILPPDGPVHRIAVPPQMAALASRKAVIRVPSNRSDRPCPYVTPIHGRAPAALALTSVSRKHHSPAQSIQFLDCCAAFGLPGIAWAHLSFGQRQKEKAALGDLGPVGA